MSKPITSTGAAQAPDDALQLERSYWETYQDYDWSADEAKQQAIACIPRLDGDILELCIGGGAFARKIPRGYRSYTGLDLSHSLLNALKTHMPHVNAVHGDAQNLPFEKTHTMPSWSSPECIICPDIATHWPVPSEFSGRAAASSVSNPMIAHGIGRRCDSCALKKSCGTSWKSIPRMRFIWIRTPSLPQCGIRVTWMFA